MKNYCFGLLMTVIINTGYCSGFMPSQADYYYQLGGTSNLFIPPVNKDQVIRIGAELDGRLGFSCNGFNPVVSISNTLKDLKKSVVNIPAGIISNLKGSVAAYPLYKLQQSMPALYNVLQNTAASAQEEFSIKVKDCQQTKQSLEQGQSPMESLLSVSDSQGWLDAASRAMHENVDVLDSAQSITQKRDEYGLPWLGAEKGNAGGKYQRPIKVINDVVIAGYNILLERKPLDTLDTASQNMPMTQTWRKPEDAAGWAVKVLGDIHVTASENKDEKREAKAGIGLSALLQSCDDANTCSQNIARALWALVDGSWSITEENLHKVSASNLLITDEIVLTIQQMPKEEHLLTVSKLSEEIAVQNMLDRALMMRRILQAGMQTQEVQNLKAALDMVKFALQKLDQDIQSLAFESDVRKKMMTETLSLIMEIKQAKLAAGGSLSGQKSPRIKHGAIYQTGDNR